LRKACIDGVRWADEMGEQAPVVSVNFSPVQFARIDVAELISQVLLETGLPPELLEVEVTEGVLIASQAKVAKLLDKISELGVSIALDDFGTGYSSLNYLKELPLNRIKVDRSFVNDLEHNPGSPIVRAIVQLGHSLELTVIAEGIENQAHLDALVNLGCDDGQGYLYSKAMTIEATNAFIRENITEVSKAVNN